jgi:copper transport protein
MRSTSTVLARLFGVALVLVATVVIAEPAGAHTDFDYSVPTDGASVGEPVSEVTVAFTLPVTLVGNGFEVLDPQGNLVQPFAVTDDDTVFRLQLDPPLAGGAAGVRYSVTAEDGHVLAGSFSFTVAVDAPPPTTTTPPATAPPATASTTASATASTISPATDAPPTSGSADTASEIDIASELTAPPELVAAQDEVISEPFDSEGSSNAGLLIGLAIAVAAAAAVFLAFRARTSAGR